MDNSAILFGSFQLEPDSGRLLRGGAPIQVGHRGLTLLQALAEAQGKTVGKSELMDKVWPGQIVEEGNLTVQVAALRKAMGTDADGRDWILTVPREGYRLIGGNGTRASLPPHPVVPSLAVLPFVNLGGDAEQDYFAEGIAEDIITALGRFKSFAVIARNSSFVYKGRAVDARQAAKELGVRYVLEGSVRRAGAALRITAQLNDAERGAHLWAEKYQGAPEDLFAFQDQITESVACLVEPQIQLAEIERSRRERPESIEAYDLYLQTLSGFLNETAEENSASYGKLRKAIEIEPSNARYLARAALLLMARHADGYEPFGPDDVAECAALARRGIAHAAGDGSVMASCALALIQTAKEYDFGMAVMRAAAEANPNGFFVMCEMGVACLHCGDIQEALACFHRSIRLSPGDPYACVSLTGVAHAYMVMGDFEEALQWANRSRAASFAFNPAYWMLIAANAQLGRIDAAKRILKEFQSRSPGVTISGINAGQPAKDPSRMAAILQGLRLAGMPER